MSWVAVVGGVVSAGVGLYSANQQKKAASKASSGVNALAGVQADTARTLQPYVGDFYSRAKRAYDPAFSFYSSLASGDRSKALSTLSPELNAIGSKYRSLANASGELNPRGGAGAAYNTDLAYRSGDEQQNLLNQSRTQGISGLVGLSQAAGQLGSSAAGGGTAAAGVGGNLFNLGYGMQRSAAADMGASYDAIAGALMNAWSKYQSRGGGSSGSNPISGSGGVGAMGFW